MPPNIRIYFQGHLAPPQNYYLCYIVHAPHAVHGRYARREIDGATFTTELNLEIH